MTAETTEKPSVLRRQIDRVGKRNRTLERENQALRRMVLVQAIKEMDLDPAEATDLVDHYRPTWSGDFERSFAPEAIHSWIVTRRLP